MTPSGVARKAGTTLACCLGLAGNLLLCILMFVAMVPVSLRALRDGTYPSDRSRKALPEGIKDTQAEFLYKIGREDSTHTDDKVKQLLTLSASLATIALLFGRDARPAWLFVLMIAALVATVFLCVSVFGVKKVMLPIPEGDAEKQKTWGVDVLRSYYADRAAHGFRTDQYRAAHRYFLLALSILAVLAALSVQKPDPAAEIAHVLRRIERFGLRLGDVKDSAPGTRPVPASSVWRDLGLIPSVRTASTLVVAGSDVLIGTNDGVWRRGLMQGNWTRSGLAGLDVRVLRTWSNRGGQRADLVFAGGDPEHLVGGFPFYWSRDGGQTWSGSADGLRDPGTRKAIPVADLAVQPATPPRQLPILYAAMSGTTIARSLDGGSNWHYVVGSPGLQATDDCFLDIAGVAPLLLYHGCEAPLDFAWIAAYEVTRRGRESFGSRVVVAPGGNQGIGNRRPNGLVTSNVDPSVAYGGLEGGVVALHGREWAWIWRGPTRDGRYTYVRTIWVDPANPQHRLFGGGQATSDSRRIGLLETHDGGETVAVVDNDLGIDFGRVAVPAGVATGVSGALPIFAIQSEEGVRVIIRDRVADAPVSSP